MTLTLADLLTIVGIVAGLALAVGGGSLAWIRADIAGMRADMTKLDERLRADMGHLDRRLRVDLARLDERQRIDMAKLDERQRADTAAINMRLDTLTQTIITSTIARSSESDLPTERTGQGIPASTAPQA